jgi:hypothetical protein
MIYTGDNIMYSIEQELDLENFGERNKNHRAGGVAQVVQCLPSKCEVLSSNPSTTK